ncbi:glycosyltransferase [Ornithinimicrobium cerasi]|uniref:Rhamnan synthesis protein F n=1 Tax=Ornithinimicrobium cerasi TaxID=2248773 RepID=A0A285VUW1_9MICO|nr:glycosyltransferase [Ornithinimicrobium cerasi]SOC57822.1 Rhamnan synthesis protein F [Ornithinimicrobium cerasi]SOC58016.1 Rhamnan synthesis protein F [Ornithinimicrobium cerasi]
MSAPFDHVLLTRFSAVLHPDAPPPDEDWLYYRLGFFVDACLPSVRSQEGARPFEWLVLLDDRCTDTFRADVEELGRGAFTPLWSHAPFRRNTFAEPVARRCAAPYLISTRIDSDDAMAVDLMAAVQAQFAGQERMFVNFPRGVQVDRSGAVYRADILSSPFLSLIERRREGEAPLTVYAAKHARARGVAPLREVRAPVMWAQVLHGTNLSNIANGVRVHPRVVGERFRIDLGYDADVTGGSLLRAQAAQLGRLARLWAAHPGELTKAVEASVGTLRGTHERPQEAGAPTLTDRVQEWERDTRTRLRHGRWSATERANALLPVRERVVSGDLADVLARDRVVVLAEWSRGARVRGDAARAAQGWADAGFGVLVVAARDPWSRLRSSTVPGGVAVVRRPNTAYDFGSWAHALRTWPALAGKKLVVLTNDSLVGPLGPLDEVVRRIDASSADVWAATENRQPVEHLQSYLLAFRDGVLSRPPLRDFFAGVQPVGSKRDVVFTYELGLTRVVDAAGLRRDVGWTHAELGAPETVDLPLGVWRQLLDAGMPFVKRVLLTGPQFAPVRAAVEQELRGLADGAR